MYSPDEVYFLEDIVKALKANRGLKFNAIDALMCPTKTEGADVHPHKCPGIPGNCELCPKQKCKQPLIIISSNGRLSILNFYFLIYTPFGSGTIGKGFISKDDDDLDKLIDGKYIIIAESIQNGA